ncbi:MAG: NAD-dependent epimerase/dehydratase family protein [Chitinophagaceae bacterium]|nr:MAG: NAD-dependent epimerase/dehydratase family protein [Chitinophagaceae bacterium]
MNKYNILLTGATGFVGQNLKPYLQNRSNQIIPFSLSEDNWRDDTLFISIDVIIHLAGKAHDTRNTSSSGEYFRVNTELTKQIFDTFLQSSARDFIFFSSVKAAADRINGILDEKVVPDPKTPYGRSKLKAEEYILAQPLPEEKRVIILRPCMIHGPGNKGNLNLLYKVVQKGIPYPLGAYNNLRSFTSIENLCFLIHKILNSEIPSGIYNVADDKSLSTIRIIELMSKEMGRRKRIWKISPSLINGLAKAGDYLHLPLNTERLKKLTESYIVSNQKLITALHTSLPVTAEEGMKQTIRSFLRQN